MIFERQECLYFDSSTLSTSGYTYIQSHAVSQTHSVFPGIVSSSLSSFSAHEANRSASLENGAPQRARLPSSSGLEEELRELREPASDPKPS